MSLETILKLSGIFLGILARSLLPWLRKLREGKAGRFSRRYLYSALASLIFGTIVTLAIFPQLEYVVSGQGFEHYFKLFCLAFGFGFGWNALVLEGTQWAGSSRPPNPPRRRTPKTPTKPIFMSRIARAVAAGYPHHILQRGNYSQTVFEEDADYRRYLDMLGECTAKFGLSIWAYCLMSDHVQYVCVPMDADSLAKALNTLHMRYSQYFNGKKNRHGHLWQGRFYSTILDDRHALEAIRYDETNPVRRGLVEDATAYPWSSARGHALGAFDPVLEDGCSIIHAAGDWKSYLGAASDGELVENIRKNMRTGRPCGDIEFVRTLEILLNRSLMARPRGRPRKTT